MSKSTRSTGRLVRYPLYTVSDLSTGIYSVAPSILLMFYMTNTLGVPVAFATVAAFLPKIVDLLAGPIIGMFSDRSKSRLGRRRSFILAGALSILPTFALLWSAPFSSPVLAATFVAVAFSFCAIAFSCYVVPYSALNSELAVDYHDSTSLNAYRAAYSMGGALLAGASAPFVVQFFGGGKPGYAIMGASLGAIMAASMLVTFMSAREPARSQAASLSSIKQMAAALVSNRPYRVLLATYFIHVTASGLLGAALAYFITYQLGREPGFLGVVFFVAFGSSILAIPLFSYIGKKTSKFLAYSLATVCSIVFYTGYYVLDAHSSEQIMILVAALAGFGEGGVQVFAFSMLIDCIRHGNGDAEVPKAEAMLSGLFMAHEKLGFATGALLAGGIFWLVGLVETTEGFARQSEGAIQGIRIATSFVPAALNALSLAVFFLYRGFDKKVGAILVAEVSTARTPTLSRSDVSMASAAERL